MSTLYSQVCFIGLLLCALAKCVHPITHNNRTAASAIGIFVFIEPPSKFCLFPDQIMLLFPPSVARKTLRGQPSPGCGYVPLIMDAPWNRRPGTFCAQL